MKLSIDKRKYAYWNSIQKWSHITSFVYIPTLTGLGSNLNSSKSFTTYNQHRTRLIFSPSLIKPTICHIYNWLCCDQKIRNQKKLNEPRVKPTNFLLRLFTSQIRLSAVGSPCQYKWFSFWIWPFPFLELITLHPLSICQQENVGLSLVLRKYKSLTIFAAKNVIFFVKTYFNICYRTLSEKKDSFFKPKCW